MFNIGVVGHLTSAALPIGLIFNPVHHMLRSISNSALLRVLIVVSSRRAGVKIDGINGTLGAGCSFAMVIQELPVELRDATCVFYLILRALDTVEDDMAIPKEVKIPMLRTFHEHLTDKYVGVLSDLLGICSDCMSLVLHECGTSPSHCLSV